MTKLKPFPFQNKQSKKKAGSCGIHLRPQLLCSNQFHPAEYSLKTSCGIQILEKSERSKCIKNSEGIDRISSLPKPILSEILSLLPTSCAVSTSFLSTRWRFLWTSITNIDIVDEDFLRRLPNMSLGKKYEIFTQFVNRVLLNLNSPRIKSFNLELLRADYVLDRFYLSSWVSAAFGRTTQKLSLRLRSTRVIVFPLTRLYCMSAPAVLILDGPIHFNIPPSSSICFSNLASLHLARVILTIASNCSVSFPSLKTLILVCVSYTNEESVNKLLASCPILDNLFIVRLGWDNVGCLVISIPSLRSLKISLSPTPEFRDGTEQKLRIYTPALKSLDLVGINSNMYFSAESFSSLFEGKLDYSFKEYYRSYVNNFLTFMGALFNVKFLSISGDILKVIGFKPAKFSTVFHNLSRLELNKNSCDDWSVVVKNLLDSMVNLEHLVLKGSCHGNHETWWTEPLHVPLCLLQRVTKISFRDMIGDCTSELELVRFFLKNGKVLQRLTVHISGGSALKLKLVWKISMMPRGSQACQVAFEGLEM